MPRPDPARDLHDFLGVLERAGELHRVRCEVDPELEVTEIATRCVRERGPALLFERVKGSPYPLAIGVFASDRRLELALGRPPAEIGAEIRAAIDRLSPPSLRGLWESRALLRRAVSLRVKRVRRAPCQEVVEEPDLGTLPALKCWPGDGGRFITYPLVITTGGGGRRRNVGLYRMQVHSREETGMHWQIQKGGGFHHHEAEARGEDLEVAVAIGADPVLLMAAMWPLPEGVDEAAFSGLIRGRPARMARAATLSIDVPADADIVLEGVVPARVRRPEGPFGDHYGHYSHAADFPVFRVRKVTRRRRPVYLAAVVGKPPQEDLWLGNSVQEMFTPFLRATRPEVRDLWSFYEGGFHTLLAVSMESRYRKEGVKTALGLLGEGQLSLSKVVVVVDHETPARSFRALLRAIRDRFVPSRDFLLLHGTSMDTLDFAGPALNLGSKMVLDATGDLGPGPPEGGVPPVLPDPRPWHPAIAGHRYLESALLAVKVRPGAGGLGRAVLEDLLRRDELRWLKAIACVSEDVDLEDDVSLIWGIFTRFDPALDVAFRRVSLRGACPVHEGPLGIDATMKPGYPEPLVMDPEVVDRVNRRWGEYGIQGP
ncbi:MAG: UbiD family decarboxylase [Planctomycetes bacterium]|nr:UbiD family decarboxylase [Planctomycetota bacterium]